MRKRIIATSLNKKRFLSGVFLTLLATVVNAHNLDVIKVADYIIDLGPEGGTGGGEVVATGTPEEVVNNPNSYTGQYLKQVL